ncbi:MAG: hypothetical protein ACK4TP_00570 [Hyphomicrobium sp.]|jgi:hypothetical protein
MKKFLPLAAVAGALFLAAGSAQAAPVSSNVLGKMTSASEQNSVVEKAHYRHHRRWWWKKRFYKRHHHRHHRRWHRWH